MRSFDLHSVPLANDLLALRLCHIVLCGAANRGARWCVGSAKPLMWLENDKVRPRRSVMATGDGGVEGTGDASSPRTRRLSINSVDVSKEKGAHSIKVEGDTYPGGLNTR